MSDHELSILNSEMEKYKKSTGLAYVLWLFIGTLGIHKFYIGKITMGIIYLVLGIGAWISLTFGITAAASGLLEGVETVASGGEVGMATGFILFIIFIIILGVMLIIDLVTIPRQIRKAYEKREAKAIEELKA